MSTCMQPRRGRHTTHAPMPCNSTSVFLENFPLAMAYVPIQQFETIYELDEALHNGTIFPELNKPFMCGKGGCSY